MLSFFHSRKHAYGQLPVITGQKIKKYCSSLVYHFPPLENECHLKNKAEKVATTEDNADNEQENGSDKRKNIDYIAIIKKIKTMMLTVYITFLVTLSIFPSLTARIKSTWTEQNKWTGNEVLYSFAFTRVIFETPGFFGALS